MTNPTKSGHLFAREHNLLPGLASGGAEEHEQGLRERLEVVVAVDVGAFLGSDFAKHLEEGGSFETSNH